MNKTSKYLELLSPPDDKYNAPEYLLAVKTLPKDITEPIPGCVYDRTDEPDGTVSLRYRLDVLQVLFWVMCRRDNPEITLEEVGQGIKGDNVRELAKEIFYFWSQSTREELEAILPDRDDEEAEDSVLESVDTGNPTDPEMKSEPLDLE